VRIGVLVINFGEPAEPTLETITPFLERIFLQNASLENHLDEAFLARARKLAMDRAPGLLEEYQAIGGSPLNAQSDEQARLLHEALEGGGWDVHTYSVFQFTDPFVAEGVARAREDGVELLVGLPVYPMCGHSTNVAALDDVRRAMDEMGWDIPFVGLSGWHSDPDYLAMRVDHIRGFVEANGLDLRDPDTLLYFSAHGTPIKYLRVGNRYDRYVEEHCRDIAEALGADRHAVGFQNHTNRRILWTQPDNEPLIESLTETNLVVDAVSFIHEQSETLAELDHELNEFIEEQGKTLYRVPVPHDDPRFIGVLSRLVRSAVEIHGGGATALTPCRCSPGSWCTNGARDLPPSPFISPDAEAAEAESGGRPHGA